MRQWWATFWDRPPGWSLLATTALVCGAALWAFSFPTPNSWILILFCLWPTVLIAVCWTVKTTTFLVRRNAWSNWILAAPLVALTSATLLVFDVPLQARWQLSQSDFAAAVEEVRSGADRADFDGRIGGYDVRDVRRHGDNVYFVVTDSGFLDDDGVAYLPDGEPTTPDPVGEGVQVWHLRGPWYSFSAGW
ncbi:hypothetical protein [Rhodococcus maanshanensis]|uniref:DUF1109 domain-containing protein n=1 Tax=Rhodococcus maanshanensis TaxID=183556 RepID=A0A1H7KFL8_9NOCA|nr:hypothetical protein [Rhodococcus maanshanensis]SEK85683.1 hypothetical protein SAMN05444583_10444 [Rhodococcus maanshanensis]